MTPTTFGTLFTSVVFATTGQLLLKSGMDRVGEISDLSAGDLFGLIPRILTTWQLMAGLGAFVVSTLFWLVSLSRVPLSTAYPFVSITYVLILVFSTVVLGERPPAVVWLGGLLVISGISLIGLGQQ